MNKNETTNLLYTEIIPCFDRRLCVSVATTHYLLLHIGILTSLLVTLWSNSIFHISLLRISLLTFSLQFLFCVRMMKYECMLISQQLRIFFSLYYLPNYIFIFPRWKCLPYPCEWRFYWDKHHHSFIL